MLTQFLSTTAEIDSMLADEFLPEVHKTKLRLLVGQRPSDESLAERNKVLEEVNNKLAQDALAASDPERLLAGNLRLSRVSSTLTAFMIEHQATLRTVILFRNNLHAVPLTLLKQLRLEKLDLSNNYLDQDTVDQVKASAFDVVIADPQKPRTASLQSTSRVYTPARANQTDAGLGFPIGPQIKKDVNPVTHTLRNQSTGSCNLL